MKPTDRLALRLKKDQLVILFLWVLINGFFLWKYGIVTTGEAPKYITQADFLLQSGHLSTPNFWLYFTQIFLIMTAQALKLGYAFVVGVQLALSLWALFSWYRLVNKYFLPKTAFLLTLLLLLNYPMHQFNVYLQTESLFFSISILFTAYLLQMEKFTARSAIFVLLLLALLAITRPTGILYIPAVFLYLFSRYITQISTTKKMLIAGSISLFFLFVLNKALGSGGELNFLLPFLEEHIICGVETRQLAAGVQTQGGNSLYGLVDYIAHHPAQFAQLAILRTTAFFGLMRNYYSTSHNIYIAAFYYTVYILVIASVRWWRRQRPAELLYFLTIILLTWCTVILTCDDWHNRFFLAISPWLLLLAGPAIDNVIKRWHQ